MDITLYDDRVLILPDEPDEKTSGGIIIPDTAKGAQRKIKATVIQTGGGLIDQQIGILTPITVKAGDRISLTPCGDEFDFDGEKYLLIREVDIDVIIEEDGDLLKRDNRENKIMYISAMDRGLINR